MYGTRGQRFDSVFLSIVIPVYRSQECLRALAGEIRSALDPMEWHYEVILVNDFSADNSWRVIEELCRNDERFIGVDLRRNFGQDNAIFTGLRMVRGSYVAIMDDDLQHDPYELPVLLRAMTDDVDVVYADVPVKHQKFWKNAGSWLHGKIADWVLYKPRGLYLSPYKIIRREIVDQLCEYSGPSPYIDGLLFQITWRVASVPAEHRRRYAGRSNYGFLRSVGVSATLLFSFSALPVRLIALTGCALALVAVCAAVLARIASAPLTATQGLALLVLFLGGVQLMLIGVIGEYVCRVYLRVSHKRQTSIRRIERKHADVGNEVPVGFDANV